MKNNRIIMEKKTWWCPQCKKLVTEFDMSPSTTHPMIVQKHCKNCGSLLILETKTEKNAPQIKGD